MTIQLNFYSGTFTNHCKEQNYWKQKKMGGRRVRTRRLKPVTEAKEVAMEAPARGSCPRCPTNMTDIICKQLINTFTVTSGPANRSCLFTSSHISSLVKDLPSWCLGGMNGEFRSLICFFVCSSSSMARFLSISV